MGYWENRQAEWMYECMEDAEKVSKELADIYVKACRYLTYETDKVYEKFKDRHALSDEDAKRLLNELRDKTDIAELRQAISQKAKTDPEYADILAKLESPAYGARIRRLEQIQAEVDWMMREVYKQEKKITTAHYIDLAINSYYREIYNVQRQVGFQFSFAEADPKAVSTLLHSNWSGKNYSQRIWDNTQELAKDVKEQIILGMVTGKTEGEMAKDLADKYATGAFEARRLVRTESNFVNGQMKLAVYDECGVEKYEFVATLDLKTSKQCRELDGKIFLSKDAMPGVNMNPMHPFCRSTTANVLDDSVKARLKRIAMDPVTGGDKLVPASMNYKEWYQQNVANNPKAQVAEKMVKNHANDKKQYERYKKVVGNKAGRSLDDFQEMKYNDPEGWSGIQIRYKDTKLKDKIKSDSTNKTIHSGKQGKHILGHNNYEAGRSYLTITEQQAQELVNKYAGTGRIIRDRNGKYTGKERVTVKKQIGVCKDLEGNEVPTKSFVIHYSKSGVHIVPTGG